MNAKICKRLRRLAEDQTIGQPLRATVWHNGLNCTINDPHTTRGVYRAMKKAKRMETA